MKRLGLAVLVGLWGAAVMGAIAFGDPIFRGSPLIIAAFLGALLAGLLVAGLLLKGSLLWNAFALLLATLLGAGLGGMFFATRTLDPFESGLFGIMMVFWECFTQAAAFFTWLLGGVAIHIISRRHSLK